MRLSKNRFDIWLPIAVVIGGVFVLFFIYPLANLLRASVYGTDGFTLENFARFFSKSYYYSTIFNSFKVSLTVTLCTLLIAMPFAYFYSFYQLKGSKALMIISLTCAMSAPFIGAYAWILLLGRTGVITSFLAKNLGIRLGDIYGFKGILLVQSMELFPLVFIYLRGAFRNIDSSLMEASENLGCKGLKRFVKVIMMLSMPTILAGALLVFMRSFADFGTPFLIGQGYRTFTVEIYQQFLSETGSDYGFASAVSVLAIVLTAAIFLIQKFAANRFKFTMNALHPIEKKKPRGIGGVLMHVYCYGVCLIGLLPHMYIVYVSFRNYKNNVLLDGYSLMNYEKAATKLLGRSIGNTLSLGMISLIIIVLFAILIAYLVVRRRNILSNAIDTVSMLPYIMPGTVIGIALVISFNTKPIVLTGTMIIMIAALVIRRMPYTIRSATATLMQIPLSIEEAAISLGASKLKTFFYITVPMMKNGIVAGAILSWVAIITEVSSAIILYNNRNITLTMSTYTAVLRGTDGVAAAFASITTVFTIISILVYLRISREEDIKL